MKTPTKVKYLELQCTCVDIGNRQWEKLMEKATRANHKTINRLVKKHLPDLYSALALEYYNPYDYFKTKTHLILVHSSIEYFISYEKI